MAAKRAILITLSAGPPLLVLGLVLGWGVDIPYFDQWYLSYEIAVATADGDLTMLRLLGQFNEHRLFFTNLTTAIVTALTGWNVRVELVIIVLIAVGYTSLIAAALSLDREELVLPLLPVFSLLTFSFSQYENWLWGFGTQWSYVILFAVAAMWVIRRNTDSQRAALGAALLVTCSMYSFIAGILMWPVGLVGMWLAGYRDPRAYINWIFVAAIALGFFFLGYAFGVGPQEDRIYSGTVGLPQYTAMILSAPFLAEIPRKLAVVDPAFMIVSVVGLALLLVNTFTVWRAEKRQTRRLSFWLMLAAFSGGSVTVIAFGRFDLPAWTALEARYVTMSSLFWLSVIVIAAMALQHITEMNSLWCRVLKWANISMGVVLLVLYLSTNTFSVMEAIPAEIAPRERAKVCVEAFPEARDLSCMNRVAPFPEILPERIDDLESRGLSVFR